MGERKKRPRCKECGRPYTKLYPRKPKGRITKDTPGFHGNTTAYVWIPPESRATPEGGRDG